MRSYARAYLATAIVTCCLFFIGLTGEILSRGAQPLFTVALTISLVLFAALGAVARIRHGIAYAQKPRNKS